MRLVTGNWCAALLFVVGVPGAFAQPIDCTGEPPAVIKVAGPHSTVDVIKIDAGISTLATPWSEISWDVKGSDIELTMAGTSQATPVVPYRCTTFYVGPIASGAYNVKLIQSIASGKSTVATLPLVISDTGTPLSTNVIPKYPIAGQPLSVRVRASSPVSPARVWPHKTTLIGNVIRLEGCIYETGFSVPSTYVAAAGVVPLPAGRYRVEYHRAGCDHLGQYVTSLKFGASWDLDVQEPGPSWPGSVDAVMPVTEYFHEGFGHYFITADENEQVALDSRAFSGWEYPAIPIAAVPNKFGFWRAADGLQPICRFFSAAFAPKSSHFYTADASECEKVKANPDWEYEGIAGYVSVPQLPSLCTQGVPLYRLYNNGHGGAPSHKYTTDATDVEIYSKQGWVAEGVVGCVPDIPAPYRP